MESSQSLYTRQSWTKPIVKPETLTWWYRTCPLVGNPWTSPLASWPHWHLPSPQTQPCVDEPEKRQQRTVRIGHEAQNETESRTAPFSKLSCAGTVRPRQVQCPLWWPAIAQVSASQHQPISLEETVQHLSARLFEMDESSGHGQLCMGLHSCSLQTQADCLPCKAGQDQINLICSWTQTHLQHLKRQTSIDTQVLRECSFHHQLVDTQVAAVCPLVDARVHKLPLCLP